MSTDLSFMQYITEQLSALSDVSYKKMFGEYMLYYRAKPVVIVCDNIAMMKKHDFLADKNLPAQAPYAGAKEHYVLDPDDRDFFVWAVTEAEKATPLPKKKKAK